MFTKRGPNAVESDEGFAIRRTARYSLEYREGDRKLEVEVEPGDGLAVYGESIRFWDSSTGGEPVTAAEKASILQNIARALDFLGVKNVIL